VDTKSLIQELQKYGLDEGEASLYYTLSRIGPSRAAAVAHAAGKKRTDAYRILDHLVEKNFVQKTLERPARYIPRPLEEALDRAMAARARTTQAMEAERQTLTKAWPRPLSVANPQQARFSIHQGPAQIMGLLTRMMDSAKEEILIAASKDGLARLDREALRQTLAARAKAGISVRFLAKHARGGDQPVLEIPGVRVRYAELPTFYQSLIIDDREICLFVTSGKGLSGSDDAVLSLNSSDLVLAQKALFDQAWAHALSPSDVAQDGLARQVQVLRGRWVRTARLREMILAASQSIQIEASSAEAASWSTHGIAAALSQQGKRGRTIVLRVPNFKVSAIPGAILDVPKKTVRRLRAIVDDRQVLLGLDTPDSSSDITPEEEWAIWSTHAGLLEAVGHEADKSASAAKLSVGE
jgi:sugar-specific transcriptional regulator TrmB